MIWPFTSARWHIDTESCQVDVVRIHPGGFRLLLVGPKSQHELTQTLTERRFMFEVAFDGEQALKKLREMPVHLLITDREPGKILGVELAKTALDEQRTSAALMLDDPLASREIIGSWVRGVFDGFLSTRMDPDVTVRLIELSLLAQWAMAQSAQAQNQTAMIDEARAAEQKERGEKHQAVRALQVEQKKVRELVKEIAMVREQLSTMHLVAGAKSNSDEGAVLNQPTSPAEEDLLFPDESPPSTSVMHAERTDLGGADDAQAVQADAATIPPDTHRLVSQPTAQSVKPQPDATAAHNSLTTAARAPETEALLAELDEVLFTD
jgi:DNA-binding NarL/FixJ family response regulator